MGVAGDTDCRLPTADYRLSCDFYDHLPNPIIAGNGGQVFADGPAVQGLPHSASIIIPANGLLVFARE